MSGNIKLKTKLVKSNFTLNMKIESKSLCDYICDELKGLDITNIKLDPEFIKYIAELIENQVKKASEDETKPNKLEFY